jgi:hypothetical protein
VGVWFHLKVRDAHLWDGVVASKWGFTSATFAERINGVLSDLRGRHFPLEDVDVEFALAIVWLPRNQAFLHQLEHGLRNDLTRARLRVAWHAVGPDRLPGDRTVHSEMYESPGFSLAKSGTAGQDPTPTPSFFHPPTRGCPIAPQPHGAPLRYQRVGSLC